MPRHFVSVVTLCSVVRLWVAGFLTKVARRPQRKHDGWLDYQECTKSLPGLGASLPSKIRNEMGLIMQTTIQMLRMFLLDCRPARAAMVLGLLVVIGFAQPSLAQTGTNPLTIFKNYFVTGDYVVAGWVEGSSNGTYATGKISFPDPKNPAQGGLPTTVPVGADIVAAYLYWGTVEGNKSTFQGQKAFFNGYQIVGDVLGNAFAPTSWSSGGCTGGSLTGSKTIRFYRADVRPFLPVDTTSGSATFGALLPNGPFTVMLSDSGSNGNTQPNALGATLVIIYRVLNPPPTLNAIVLYDGSYAPSNTIPNMSQTMVGFYQPSNTQPIAAKLTQIVADGQPNKGETITFGASNTALPSLYTAIYGATAPPFPGLYGMWDNPTWSVGGFMNANDTSETTTIAPASTGSGCVNWGAMILSTTVQDSDGDGLLDTWEDNQGYTNAVPDALGNYQWVALPGANKNVKDIFVEVDYLSNLDGSADPYLHSHLPKQAALDAVAAAFAQQIPPINMHFDLGPNIYQGDLHVISYPVPIPNPLPLGTSPPQAGTGGNAVSEATVLCTDGAVLCAFPGQPAIGWKGDFVSFRNDPALGNFQFGRGQSYHYVLFGHSLGAPRSYWSTYGADLADLTIPQLASIAISGNTATITIKSPQGVVKPGDCSVLPPLTPPPTCSDASNSRVTIAGALGQTNLNGTYSPFTVMSSKTDNNNVTTTIFTVTTANVAPGTYTFANEPQLAVAYLGPTSTSGHSDFGGGGDSAVTLGLWGADDPAGCIADPSQALIGAQVYCNNQVGTTAVQTGTLLHELGHSLTLTHGGTYYEDVANPSLPTYELNCKPNFLSVMNYLFQVRGFVDNHGFDFSGQTMPALNETTSIVAGNPPVPALSELSGIGNDVVTLASATHLTRWYSAPNAIDTQLQNQTGGRYATAHCDGTPLTATEVAACALNPQNCSVRVDGTVAPGGTSSAPLDWNNNLKVPPPDDPIPVPGEDLNHNGVIGDSPFSGFNDWSVVNPIPAYNGVALQQMSVRANAFGASGGGLGSKGGGLGSKGGGIDSEGGGLGSKGGGLGSKGGGLGSKGGGVDLDEDTAQSTVDAPSGPTCSTPLQGVPGCVSSTPTTFVENAKSVPLSWAYPGSTQIRFAYVYRAVGSFPTPQDVKVNFSKFTIIKTLTGSPPTTTYIDPNVKNQTTYTYVLTDKNKQGALSETSPTPLVVSVKF